MIKSCRSCNSKYLVDVADFGEQHLSEFRDDNNRPDKHPLSLVLCTNCTLVQLKESTPPSKLYTDNYGYRSGINNTIKADLKDIVKKARKIVNLNPFDVVVDIGANDGTLLSNYADPNYVQPIRVAFEPVPKLANDAKNHAEYVINDYFNAEAYIEQLKDKKAKIITFISCFYDLEEPNKVVADLASILDKDGILIIEQNYLARMLTQNAFDNIVHEHIEYYTLTSLEHLLNRHYLEVVGIKETSINGGAFRVYVRHMNTLDKYRQMEKKMKLDNKWTYMLFSLRVESIKDKLHKLIEEIVKEGKSVYLYGASTRGNSLIQVCGLDNKLIKAAVERNPEKWGKKILGIPIISEEQARKEKPDYALILPWFFSPEIIDRDKEFIDNGGKWIIPLPEPYIVDKDGEHKI